MVSIWIRKLFIKFQKIFIKYKKNEIVFDNPSNFLKKNKHFYDLSFFK